MVQREPHDGAGGYTELCEVCFVYLCSGMAVVAPAVVDLTSDEFALELQHEELLRQQALARDEAYAQQLAMGLEEAFDDEVTLAEQHALAESIAEVASARDAVFARRVNAARGVAAADAAAAREHQRAESLQEEILRRDKELAMRLSLCPENEWQRGGDLLEHADAGRDGPIRQLVQDAAAQRRAATDAEKAAEEAALAAACILDEEAAGRGRKRRMDEAGLEHHAARRPPPRGDAASAEQPTALEPDEMPGDGRRYLMYHGTRPEAADAIEKYGFTPSADGMLGPGVYLSRDVTKAARYPLDVERDDVANRVILECLVRVGKVKRIDARHHPTQKTWFKEGYDTAWVPPHCGMVASGLEEDCVSNPERIVVLRRVPVPAAPRPQANASRKRKQPVLVHKCLICLEDKGQEEIVCCELPEAVPASAAAAGASGAGGSGVAGSAVGGSRGAGSSSSRGAAGAAAQCQHWVCRPCMTEYCEKEADNRQAVVKCVHPECAGCAPDTLCEDLLGAQSLALSKLRQAQAMSIIPVEKRIYCPNRECSAVFERPEEGEIDGWPRAQCPHCHKALCVRCAVPWHEGLDCDAFQSLPAHLRAAEDIALLQHARDTGLRSCPRCRQLVERQGQDQCNFVECRCGCAFCYACGVAYRSTAQTAQNVHGTPGCACGLFTELVAHANAAAVAQAGEDDRPALPPRHPSFCAGLLDFGRQGCPNQKSHRCQHGMCGRCCACGVHGQGARRHARGR